MAANYENLTTRPGIQFIGGTQTQDTQVISFNTLPHGVYLEVSIAQKDFTAEGAKSDANGFGIVIEQLFSIQGVTDVEWSQVPLKSGQLGDQLTVTVESDSGNSTGQFVVPFRQLTKQFVAGKAGALVSQLNDAEA